MSSSSTSRNQARSRSIAAITGCPPNMKATPKVAMMSPTSVTWNLTDRHQVITSTRKRLTRCGRNPYLMSVVGPSRRSMQCGDVSGVGVDRRRPSCCQNGANDPQQKSAREMMNVGAFNSRQPLVPNIGQSSKRRSDASQIDGAVRGDVVDLAARNADVLKLPIIQAA
jgi:hypothetical protein